MIDSLYYFALLSGILFSDNFECGALGNAKLIDAQPIHQKFEQDRQMSRADSSTCYTYFYEITTKEDPKNPVDKKLEPSSRWFYFRMSGVKDKSLDIKFRHTDARRPFYSYDNKQFTRFTESESPEENHIVKRFSQDTVYLAYFIPYTNGYLNSRINEWSRRECVKVSSIGKSAQRRNMQLLTISNGIKGNKKQIYIHGRVHPSEAPASWHLDRMIEILSSDSEYARSLRREADFYILPFANPDGVYNGMSRCVANGVNIEINWDRKNKETTREVKNIRRFLKKRKIDIMLNMHSQSQNHATFWVHNAKSTSDAYFKDLRYYASLHLCGNQYLKAEDLDYSSVAPRYIEGWYWNKDKENTIAFCFETPYTYYNEKKEGHWVSIENLNQLAVHNVHGIGDYLKIPSRERIVTDNAPIPDSPATERNLSTGRNLGKIFCGENYLVSLSDSVTVKYNILLPTNTRSGDIYNCYYWNVTDEPADNCWVKFSQVQVDDAALSTKSITVERVLAEGEIADAILLELQK